MPLTLKELLRCERGANGIPKGFMIAHVMVIKVAEMACGVSQRRLQRLDAVGGFCCKITPVPIISTAMP